MHGVNILFEYFSFYLKNNTYEHKRMKGYLKKISQILW